MKKGFDLLISLFLKATDELIDVLELFPNEAKIDDEFSAILLYAYQMLIFDLLPSMSQSIYDKRIFSFVCMVRSVLDVTYFIQWVDSLPAEEKKHTAKAFLNFNGAEMVVGKAKPIYEFGKMPGITDKTTRQKSIDLKIDMEGYRINQDGPKLTAYDYLSKVVHFNPAIIKELIVLDEGLKISHSPKYYEMQAIACRHAADCLLLFTSLFVQNFYKNHTSHEDANKKILDIHERFHRQFHEILSSIIATTETEAIQGQEVLLCKAGKPVAKVVAYEPQLQQRQLGLWKGKIQIADDFDELPPELKDYFS